MFGTQAEELAACNPTATAFPGGTMFASECPEQAYSPGERGWVLPGAADDYWPGHLLSFVRADDNAHFRSVRAIPRITSKGQLCGAVFRVGSKPDLAGPSASHVQGF